VTDDRHSTFDTDEPWVVYHYGRTHDAFWPPWRSTRLLGYGLIECECAVCGKREVLKIRIPRFGPVIDRGKHPKRIRFLLDHLHPDKGHPMSWAKPLLNPDAHPGGMNLDMLAMRLEAELREALD